MEHGIHMTPLTQNEIDVRRAVCLGVIWGLRPAMVAQMTKAARRRDWITYRRILRSPKR
jgi:hypothetical protein